MLGRFTHVTLSLSRGAGSGCTSLQFVCVEERLTIRDGNSTEAHDI